MPGPSANNAPESQDDQGSRRGAFRTNHRPPLHKAPSRAQEEGTAIGGPRLVEQILQEHPERVHRVVLLKNSGEPWLYNLQKIAESHKIQVQQVDWPVLDSLAFPSHGAVAVLHARALTPWEEMRNDLVQNGGLVIILAGLEDPHNLGACARSALALGAKGILLPQKGTVGITPAGIRAGAGALELLPVSKPPVLEKAVDELIQAGYSVYGLDARGEPMHTQEYPERIALVLGGEDKGIPPYLRKRCGSLLRLPMSKTAHSYNASVALSIALYEIARKQNFSGLE